MKLHLLNKSSVDNDCFSVSHNFYQHFLKIWHYHPEVELVLILKSTGTRFIGDSIKKFDEGDVVLIGKNLPHMWLNDEVYFQKESTLFASAIAIHFKEDFLGTSFFGVAEMKLISKMLERSSSGIHFLNVSEDIKKRVSELIVIQGFDKIVKLLELFNLLANHKDYELIVSSGFVNENKESGIVKLDKLNEYIFKNFNSEISSKEAAKIVFMNHSAFSRFFKRVHRKTFTRYLNEIRIGYACKLLLEPDYFIAQICYDCGFNNLSNFNKHFKSIKGLSPSEYVKSYTKIQ